MEEFSELNYHVFYSFLCRLFLAETTTRSEVEAPNRTLCVPSGGTSPDAQS